MTFLYKNLEGLFVPCGTKNPLFKFTTGFGPSFVRRAFSICISNNDYQIRTVLPRGDMVLEEDFIDDHSDIREVIYIAFNELNRWIFIYDITEDIGLLFSDESPEKLVADVDISNADKQFDEVCRKWAASQNVVHAASIQKWIDIRYCSQI